MIDWEVNRQQTQYEAFYQHKSFACILSNDRNGYTTYDIIINQKFDSTFNCLSCDKAHVLGLLQKALEPIKFLSSITAKPKRKRNGLRDIKVLSETEYIRLKAIEQAAIDFVKSDKVIENIEDLSYSNLKELLPIENNSNTDKLIDVSFNVGFTINNDSFISWNEILDGSHFIYYNGKYNLGLKLSDDTYYSYYNSRVYTRLTFNDKPMLNKCIPVENASVKIQITD